MSPESRALAEDRASRRQHTGAAHRRPDPPRPRWGRRWHPQIAPDGWIMLALLVLGFVTVLVVVLLSLAFVTSLAGAGY